MSNLELWSKVEKTDPKYTKTFKRGGGFEGTAINATYNARKATEIFGPMGLGWGIKVLKEQIIDGAGNDKVHTVHIQLWYMIGDKRGEIEHFGQTLMVGTNRNGPFTDEEAPKKSLTDATNKALSMLGFSADVHLGLYDDNKYVRDLKREFAEDKPAAPSVPANSVNAATKAEVENPPLDSDYDEITKIEAELKADINQKNSVQEVTDYMLSDSTKGLMKRLPKDISEGVRSYAKERLREVAKPGNKKAA